MTNDLYSTTSASASSRFASRATELESAADEGAKGSVTGMQGPMGRRPHP
ncbi:MAG: hypothetical protein L0H93_14355 [Nocardioides sp.]|nr:hypothetical protein [Nocardioides sp.]